MTDIEEGNEVLQDDSAPEDCVVIRLIAEKVPGEVKWYSMKKRYGFIQREDTKEDIFVHRSGILKFKRVPCLWRGLKVECSVVETNKGIKAESVTAPNGEEIVRIRVRRPRDERPVDGEEGTGEGEVRRRPRPPRRRVQNGEAGAGGEQTYYDATGNHNGGGGENGHGIEGGADGRGARRGGRKRGPRRGRGGVSGNGGGGLAGVEGGGDGQYEEGVANGTAPGPRQRNRRPRRGRGRGGMSGEREGDVDIVGDNLGNMKIESGEYRGRGRGSNYMRGRGGVRGDNYYRGAGDNPGANKNGTAQAVPAGSD